MLILIFFVYASAGCKQKATGEVSLVWSGKQATGIFISNSFFGKDDQEKTIQAGLQVFLQKSGQPMLGEYGPAGEGIIFRPLIPLSPGKRYEVFFKNKLIGRLPVPLPGAAVAPEILALYPSADTLPENLLKIYLQFSSPMREGEALRHIHLLNERADTLSLVFLDLQPELWNKERTTLTVWLDPGRIKRGLIPNQRLGNPLKKAAHYTLAVDADWKDIQGLPLKHGFTKKFFVRERDDTTPQPGLWKLVTPRANTFQPLRMCFAESLDYFLIGETVRIIKEKDAVVEGRMTPNDKETGTEFIPAKPWQPGKYRLRIAAYLEDLAGNNLNRPFDRDLTLQQKKDDVFVEREFVIEER